MISRQQLLKGLALATAALISQPATSGSPAGAVQGRVMQRAGQRLAPGTKGGGDGDGASATGIRIGKQPASQVQIKQLKTDGGIGGVQGATQIRIGKQPAGQQSIRLKSMKGQ